MSPAELETKKENSMYIKIIAVISLLGGIGTMWLTEMPIGAGPFDYVMFFLIGAFLAPAYLAVLALFVGLITMNS